MLYTDDPGRDAYMHDMAAEEWLAARPVCQICGNPIQDDRAVMIGGAYICFGCIEENTVYLEGREW